MEIYVDVNDFWERTGLTVAACDACDRAIFRGGGHLLSTEEVTRSRWYREHCVPQALSEVKEIMNISLSEDETREAQLIMIHMAGRSQTQWMVCDECLGNLTGR